MIVFLQLTTAGIDSGPFDLYSNLDAYSEPFEENVSRDSLIAGYSTDVPDYATTVRITSKENCISSVDITLRDVECDLDGYTVEITTTTTTTTIPSVIICDQEWSLYNLDVATYSDGTIIPEVQDIFEWESLTTGAWCYYNNDSANGTIYGKLYNWYAVAGIWDSYSISDPSLRKQLAPTGYHIPSYDEWMVLRENCLSGLNVAGGKMKATGTIQAGTGLWETPNAGATNESGFTGLPGGRRERDPGSSNLYEFMGRNVGALFWSSTETGTPETSWHFALSFINTDLYRDGMLFNVGMSVRLIKD
jgi:uncharacterized protein (TIGR02145 family)